MLKRENIRASNLYKQVELIDKKVKDLGEKIHLLQKMIGDMR